MRIIRFASMVLLIAITGSACTKDNTTSPSTNPVTGSWRVSSFVKDNTDMTSQFSGYTFSCTSNGSMSIDGNGNAYNSCTWNSNGMMSSAVYHFQIMGCDSSSVLWECDEDWDLSSSDSQHCNFTDHNPNHHTTMAWVKI